MSGLAGWMRRLSGLALSFSLLLTAAPSAQAADPIVIGIDRDDPPHQFMSEDGVPTGFDVELIEAAAQAVGLEIEIRAGEWADIRRQLEAGEIDASPGVVKTPEREALLDFSVPTVTVEYTIFVPDYSSIATLADLVDRDVAVEAGAVWDDRLTALAPSARQTRTGTSPEALDLLIRGDVDAAVLKHTQGLYLLRESDASGFRSTGLPLATEVYRFAVPDERKELLAHLNDGLMRVRSDGTYDALYDAWFGVLKPQSSALSSSTGRALLGVAALLAALLLAAALLNRVLRRKVEARTRALSESERDKRELQQQLLQAQKTEALGRLAGGVAHDFNNLLTIVLGNVGVALAQSDGDGRAAAALRAIRKAGRAGADLTQQLLAFSRRQAVAPRALVWNDVLNEASDMLGRLLGSAVQLRLLPQPGLPSVRLDPSQALQVLMNLVINARDAVEGEGCISVETCAETRAGTEFVRLTVSDDGVGMSAEVRERIFEPFFTTRPGGAGTGLGLATACGIVEQNGGTIEVESEPGAGSSFHVWLPRCDADAPEAAPPVVAAVGKVLVVEDDAEVRALAMQLIQELGHPVSQAEDAEAALRVLASERVDTLVTDVDLRGMSGVELARQALEHSPGLRVVLCSAYSGSFDLPGALVRFAPKPFTRESFAAAFE